MQVLTLRLAGGFATIETLKRCAMGRFWLS